MGACASLCRVETAPRRHAKKREATPEKAIPRGDAASAAGASDAPPAAVSLGFSSGFPERYELGDELGHGQFATVRAARDRETGRAVAVKVIPKSLLSEPENAEHIRREVRIHSRARKPSRVARRSQPHRR